MKDDYIRRQDAINALSRKMVSIPTAGRKDLMGNLNRIRAEDISVIKRLPSAHPEIIRCKDCRFWDAYPSCSAFFDLHVCRYRMRITTEADDFCSKAERKDNG